MLSYIAKEPLRSHLSLSQHEALALEEDMNVFLDELVDTLRRLE